MTRSAVLLVLAALLAACSDDATGPTVVLTAPATTTSAAPAPTTTTTTTPPPATTTTTTAAAPDREAVGDCPELFLPEDVDAEFTGQRLEGHDPDGGTLLWRIPLGSRDVIWRTAPEALVLAGPDAVRALDPRTCRQIWSAPFPAAVNLAVDSQASRAYVTTEGTVAALDLADGTARWTAVLDPEPLGRGLFGAAVPAGDLVLVPGTVTGEIRALDAATGETRYTTRVPDARLTGAAAVAADAFYVSAGSTVAAFDLADGTLRWSFDPGFAAKTAAPAVGGGAVFVAADTGTIVLALDAASGEERWRRDFPDGRTLTSGAALGHDEIHVTDFAGRVHHLDPADGSSVYTGTYPPFGLFAEFDDGMFTVQEEGTVTAYDLFERRRWSIETGADQLGTFTLIDMAGDVVVAFSFSAERF